MEFRKKMAQVLSIEVNDMVKRTSQNTYYVFTLNPHSKKEYTRSYGYDDAITNEPVLN